MKAPILALALIVVAAPGGSAHAIIPSPILRFETTNGSVPPPDRTVKTCEINSDTVIRTVRGPSIRAVPVVTRTAYTADVRDANEIRRLIRDAKKGDLLDEGVGPVFTGLVTYQAAESIVKPKFIVLKKLAMRVSERRTGAAARKLVKFIDFNCNQQ